MRATCVENTYNQNTGIWHSRAGAHARIDIPRLNCPDNINQAYKLRLRITLLAGFSQYN